MRRMWRVAVSVLAVAALLSAGCGGRTQSAAEGGGGGVTWPVKTDVKPLAAPPVLKTFHANAEDLQHTVVTAQLREPHAEGKSLVWCASMQMAWDEAARHFGGRLQLNGAPPMGVTLDEHLVGPGDLDPDSYVALAGFGRDGILARIPAAIAAKFGPDQKPSLLPATLLPDDLCAYAFLLKNLEFEFAFKARGEDPLKFQNRTPVQAWGLWPGAWTDDDTQTGWDICGQVGIDAYVEDGDCIVELPTKDGKDRVILAKIEPGATLKDDLDRVLPKLGGKRERMRSIDSFLVPALDFAFLRTYDEIIKHTIGAPCVDGPSAGEKYEIASAVQTVEFKLDQSGAKLKSEAMMMATPAAVPDPNYVPPLPPKPKLLIFDRPFLVLLMHKDAKMPYLALWVDNAELLQAVK